MTQRMSFGIQNDLIRYVPRGPQQTRSGVNWKSGGCGPIFQQNTLNVTYEAPTTPWDTTAGKVSLWTGVVSGGLGILAQGCQAFGLTKFPFIQRFVQSFGNQAMTYQPYGAYGMGGYTNSLGMGSPFSFGGGCTNTYGMLNTGMQQRIPTGNANYQQNLSQMYSSYKVLDNGNGTYTLTSGKGDNIKTGTYEELMKGMEGAAKTDESQGAGAKESPAKASGSETPSNQSADAKAPASAPASDSAKAAPAASGGGETQGVSPKKSGSKSSGKVNVPAGWYRADTGHAEGKSLKLNQCKSATAAMNKILSAKMDYLSGSDREALTKELIRNNPSVFNKDGTVKAGANWDKLDVPSIKYIKQKYVDGATYSTGKVTYTSKKDKRSYTNASTVSGAGGKVIRGKNGYFVTFAKGTARYFDPAGNPIRPEEFKKHCPNIYKTASSYAQK